MDNDYPTEPADGDYIISDSRDGYSVTEYKYIGTYDSMDEALTMIQERMESEKFWPDVWFVNDHGNLDLLKGATGEILASYV